MRQQVPCVDSHPGWRAARDRQVEGDTQPWWRTRPGIEPDHVSCGSLMSRISVALAPLPGNALSGRHTAGPFRGLTSPRRRWSSRSRR